jgi:hypothetical protein
MAYLVYNLLKDGVGFQAGIDPPNRPGKVCHTGAKAGSNRFLIRFRA